MYPPFRASWQMATRPSHVSSSPSKIPYGGFSPVRLQTGIQPRPSVSLVGLSLGPHTPATDALYAAKSFLLPPDQRVQPNAVLSRSGPVAKRHDHQQNGAIPSRGPWLRGGLCVPLDLRLLWPHPSLSALFHPLMHSRVALSNPGACLGSGPEKVPNLLPVSVPSCRPPYPGGPDGCLWLCFTIRAGLRHFRTGSASTCSTHVGSGVGLVTRLQGSLNATARTLARPSPTRAVYAQAFTGLDRSTPMSSITTRAYSHFPRPDLHRQETRHYGLQTDYSRVEDEAIPKIDQGTTSSPLAEPDMQISRIRLYPLLSPMACAGSCAVVPHRYTRPMRVRSS